MTCIFSVRQIINTTHVFTCKVQGTFSPEPHGTAFVQLGGEYPADV